MIEINQTYLHPCQFSQEDVIAFAKVTGDTNPIHLDAVYAANTRFKRTIMHGMLGASMFSKLLGTVFPGEGTVYLSQTLSFMRPMFVDTAYEVRLTVKEVDKEKNRAVITTEIFDKATGMLTIGGEAAVMLP